MLLEHTKLARDQIDPEQHAANLRESLGFSRTCVVRRRGELVAYAMLNQVSGSSWFVRGFNTYPGHRNASVVRELLQQMCELACQEGIAELRSNVYKTNRQSMVFHRRLGFRVTKENTKGVEFFVTVEDLSSIPLIGRLNHAVDRGPRVLPHRCGADSCLGPCQ